MLQAFTIAFGAGLGLMASLVAVALLFGTIESLSNAVRLARMRQRIKRQTMD